MTATKERGAIRQTGMGGFLNPPGHPEHTHHIETDLRRRPWNRGGMSLSTAVKCEYLDDATRAAARKLLDTWLANKQPLDSPEVQGWVRQVLGSFKGCFKGQETAPGAGDEWDVGKLRINSEVDPLLNADLHAGVHLIRKYYPEFIPTAEHFGGAYWGEKPE